MGLNGLALPVGCILCLFGVEKSGQVQQLLKVAKQRLANSELIQFQATKNVECLLASFFSDSRRTPLSADIVRRYEIIFLTFLHASTQDKEEFSQSSFLFVSCLCKLHELSSRFNQ